MRTPVNIQSGRNMNIKRSKKFDLICL